MHAMGLTITKFGRTCDLDMRKWLTLKSKIISFFPLLTHPFAPLDRACRLLTNTLVYFV